MLLAIDIGNTNITFGIFKGKKLLKKLSFPTANLYTPWILTPGGSKVLQKLKRGLARYKVEAIVICSVVPKAERVMMRNLTKLFKIKPLILGRDIKVPIKNLYKKPKQVGQDRLVNAYAGHSFYKPPLIIIDFGTAVTLDVISKEGAYLGGIITPGIELSLNALSEKAALLPSIRLKKIPNVLGKTTADSMASGIIYGFASMCDGLVVRLKKRIGSNFNVVATGGNAHLILKFSTSIKKLDENLTLKGINLIFQNLSKSP
jgi:type III pantothenate kinase